MALRHIVSFAQLPTTQFSQPVISFFTPGPTAKLRGTPLYLYNSWSGNTQYVTNSQAPQMFQQDGYLWLRRGWGNGQGYGTNVQPFTRNSIYIPLKEIAANLSATSKIIIGFRARIKDYLKNSVGILHDTAYTTNQALFSPNDVPNFKADAPYYFEVQIDFSKLVVNRWIDGVVLAPVTLTAAQVSAWVAGGFFSFNTPGGINVDTYSSGNGGNPNTDQRDNAQVGFRDIYILEDTADDSQNQRLGPQIVTALAPIAADNTDWTATPTGKSVLETLNLPYTAAGIDGDQTSFVTAGNSLTPVALKFAAPAANAKINGVSLNLAAWRPTGTVGVLQSQVTVGQAKTTAKLLNISTVPDYSLVAGVFEKAPDGAAWTTDKVSNAVLTLAPAAGS